jgi:hypothetical protein
MDAWPGDLCSRKTPRRHEPPQLLVFEDEGSDVFLFVEYDAPIDAV